MKRLFATMGMLLLACSLFAFDFIIDDFHLDVEVDLSNSYAITQSLEVDYQRPCHGFLQDIPLLFGRKRVTIDDFHSSEPMTVDLSDPSVALMRFGSADKLVTGKKQYLLSYRYTVGDDGKKEYDEIYLNLIGNEWDSHILKGSFSLTLPKDPGVNPDAWLTYGMKGSSSLAPLSYNQKTFTFTGSVMNLLPGEGMTIRIELPEGYFSEVQKEIDWGSSMLVASLALGIFLTLLAFFIWSRYGRDELISPVPDWHAPDGLSPLEVGYLYDCKVDGRDLAGMFFYWADQGYLSMKELKRGVWQFTKLKEPETERSFEKRFFDDLFKEGDGTVVTTRDLQSESFAKACQRVARETRRYFRGERALKDEKAEGKKLSIQLFLLFPLTLGAIGASWPYPDGVMVGMMAVGVMCELLIANIAHSLLVQAYTLKWIQKIAKATGVILLLFFASFLNFTLALQYLYLSPWQGVMVVLVTVILPSVMSLTAQATQKRSPYGARMHSRILGFCDFIEKVEMDRLRLLVSETPELFFHVLGYAMALDLEKKWTSSFQRLGEQMLNPSWLETRNPIGSYLLFYALTRQFCTPIASGMAYHPEPKGGRIGPVSSFGGFSGHSGGGFGGGGGRAW